MDFCKRTIRLNNQNITYDKPKKCPSCDVVIEAVECSPLICQYGKDEKIVFVPMRCPSCERSFISIYEWPCEHIPLKFIQVLPLTSTKPVPERLKNVSPRGAHMAEDARLADAMDMEKLAAIGYRTALELFVKDYAIVVLGNKQEDVEHKKLAQAISDYLKDDAFNTGDAVRILGTDYAHYIQRNDASFEDMRFYFDAFIDVLDGYCRIKNPIVTRARK